MILAPLTLKSGPLLWLESNLSPLKSWKQLKKVQDTLDPIIIH